MWVSCKLRSLCMMKRPLNFVAYLQVLPFTGFYCSILPSSFFGSYLPPFILFLSPLQKGS